MSPRGIQCIRVLRTRLAFAMSVRAGVFALVAVLVAVLCVVSTSALPTLDCKFENTANVTIKIINKCGGNVNIRTCPLKFQQCVGYPKSPNYYQVRQ